MGFSVYCIRKVEYLILGKVMILVSEFYVFRDCTVPVRTSFEDEAMDRPVHILERISWYHPFASWTPGRRCTHLGSCHSVSVS